MVKKTLPWLAFISITLLIVVGIVSKDRLNQYLSNTMVNNAAPELINEEAAYIDSVFNYTKFSSNYDFTFLEFGAKGCVSCRKMEGVMDEVKQIYPNKVNVVFLNVLKQENKRLMNFFGVVYIPTQVLLNKSGEEYYRHTGFIGFDELSKRFESIENVK